MARQYYDYKTGLGNVGSYQASGRPYLSSSIHLSSSNSVVKVEFPSVSRFVTIKNEGPAASDEVQFRVGFSQNGVNAVENTNYLLLDNQESFSADYRVTAVYLRVNPTGGTFKRDGQASEIDLNLGFVEYKTLTKKDIQDGF